MPCKREKMSGGRERWGGGGHPGERRRSGLVPETLPDRSESCQGTNLSWGEVGGGHESSRCTKQQSLASKTFLYCSFARFLYYADDLWWNIKDDLGLWGSKGPGAVKGDNGAQRSPACLCGLSLREPGNETEHRRRGRAAASSTGPTGYRDNSRSGG